MVGKESSATERIRHLITLGITNPLILLQRAAARFNSLGKAEGNTRRRDFDTLCLKRNMRYRHLGGCFLGLILALVFPGQGFSRPPFLEIQKAHLACWPVTDTECCLFCAEDATGPWMAASGSCIEVNGMRRFTQLESNQEAVTRFALQPTPLSHPKPIVVDDFDGAFVRSSWEYVENQSVTFRHTNQHLAITGWGKWGRTDTNNVASTYTSCSRWKPLDILNRKAVEMRVDLVRGATDDAFAVLAWNGVSGGYLVTKDVNEIALWKWVMDPFETFVFYSETNAVKNKNVVLVMTLIGADADVVYNMRVLDKDNGNAVLFDKTVMDTPRSDPVLTYKNCKRFRERAGARLGTCSSIGLGLWQYTDGKQPAHEVVFDNFEAAVYSLPALTVQSAVQVTWPEQYASGWHLMAAPSPLGPWTPVKDPVVSSGGKYRVTVPSPDGQPMQFYRPWPVP